MKDSDKTKEQLIDELEELRQKVAELDPPEARSSKRAKPFADAREEWERTFDIIPDPISVIDRQHRFVWVNKTMANRFGIAPGEAVGSTCYESVHGMAEPPSFCAHTKLLADGKEHTVEFYEKRLGGYFIASVSPLHDAEGRVIASIHVTRDITERRKAEQVLQTAHDRLEQRATELVKLNENLEQEIEERKQAENKLHYSESTIRALLDSTSDTILMIDTEGKVLVTNEGTADRLGYSVDGLIGKCIYDFLPPKVAKLRKGYADQVIKTKKPVRFTDGRADFFLDSMVIPVVGESGEVQRLAIFARDVTEVVRAEKRYEKLLDSMQAGFALHEVITNDKNEPIDYRFLAVNPAYEEMTGLKADEIIGNTVREVLPAVEDSWIKTFGKVAITGKPTYLEEYTKPLDKWFSVTGWSPEPGCFAVSVIDITERKRADEVLRQSESALRAKSEELEELNAALKVLLKRREKDKENLQDAVLVNVKELILPYIEKLKSDLVSPQQATLVSIIESNVEEIVSPFATKLSSKFLNLTPTELQVASLVKDGRSSNEIAELMNLSPHTILFHRHNLRRKLGLKNRKVNLRSYLRSLQD